MSSKSTESHISKRDAYEKPIYFEKPGYRDCPVVFVEEKEISIPGVKPNYYTANNIGQVFNKKGEVLKPCKINTNYYKYSLISDGTTGAKYKSVLAHRLFMNTFFPIDNPEDYTINHKNMDKSDNRLCNLERVSQKENNDKKNEVLITDGTRNYQALFKLSDLKIILEEFKNGTPYGEILRILGKPDTKVNRDYVGNIKRGKTYKREVRMLSELSNE